MMLKIYYNDAVDWVVAESPEDATKVWEEHLGEDAADYDLEWLEETREAFSIGFDNCCCPNPLPENGIAEPINSRRIEVIASPAAWIKQNGRGFLCSTEW